MLATFGQQAPRSAASDFAGGAGFMGMGGPALPLAASRASAKRAHDAEEAAASAPRGRKARAECAATLQAAATLGFPPLPPLLPPFHAPPFALPAAAAPISVFSEDDGDGEDDIAVFLPQAYRSSNALRFLAPPRAVRLFRFHAPRST